MPRKSGLSLLDGPGQGLAHSSLMGVDQKDLGVRTGWGGWGGGVQLDIHTPRFADYRPAIFP